MGAIAVAATVATFLPSGTDKVGDEGAPRRTKPDAELAAAAPALREAGVSGVLYLSDERCRVRALSLPSLQPQEPSVALACRFPISSRSRPGRAWLSDTRLVAVVRAGQGHSVGLFERGRLVARSTLRRPRLALLRVSPRGTWVALREPPFGTIWLLRVRRRSLSLEPFPPWSPPAPTDIRAIAWSPDERFAVVASLSAVYVFRTGAPEEGFVGLPLAVADLDWR